MKFLQYILRSRLIMHIKTCLIVALMLNLMINSFGQAPLVEDLGYKGGSIPGIKKLPNALNFLVIGDWGRNGENYQKEVAASMGKAAHDLRSEFTIATGDNFYPFGVQSAQDYHWIVSFENIYTAQSLHEEWYPVLGNHDYGTNPDAQIEYSKVSSRWRMPSRYYSKTFNERDTSKSVLILFIDTDPIEKEFRGAPYDSIKYVKGYVDKQKTWIEDQLKNSKAKWKFVVGHHAPYTGGWRNGTEDEMKMRAFLSPIFEKYGVDIYICGHEHHLEHTKPKGKTHYIISGAGSEARPAKINPDGGIFTAATQGYAAFSVTSNQVLVQFIDYKDQILHTSTITK